MSTGGETSGAGKRYYAEPRTHNRDPGDFYIEPAWAVDLLLDAEPFYGDVYDPACGSGVIVRQFRARGIDAFGTDIVSRGFAPGGRDFLDYAPTDHRPAANIVSNPPYALAQAFVEKALSIATHKVAMLVQAKFPYSQRRHALFSQRPPARIYFLSTRPSMPPGDKLLAGTVVAKGGKLDYAWIVWSKDHRGPTQAHWLLRERDGQKKEEAQEPGPDSKQQSRAEAARHDAAA